MNQVVKDAVAALALLNPRTRRQAAALLSGWARRDTLTAADRRAVLDTFRGRAR